MKIWQTKLSGVFVVEPTVYEDSRGYFFESFRKDKFEEAIGYSVDFVQDNESFSKKGVLRGLHYQLPPFEQAKLVRAVKGRILDVAVDLRKSSPNFGKWVAVELSQYNRWQLFIPRGFAHGFLVLSDEAIVVYKVDNYYSREHDRGIRFDDPQISIDWPMDRTKIILSSKDAGLAFLRDAEVFE